MIDRARRRLLMAGAGAAFLAPLGTLAKALEPTPRQPAGPFYPAKPPLDDDNDLTRVAGHAARAKGVICDLSGAGSRCQRTSAGKPPRRDLAMRRQRALPSSARSRHHPARPGLPGSRSCAHRRRRALSLPDHPPRVLPGAHTAHPRGGVPARWAAVRHPALRRR